MLARTVRSIQTQVTRVRARNVEQGAFAPGPRNFQSPAYGDVIYQQTDYFLYSRLDLVHAAR